jgi:DNA repair exonuclease SbcCD ATPase subunit
MTQEDQTNKQRLLLLEQQVAQLTTEKIQFEQEQLFLKEKLGTNSVEEIVAMVKQARRPDIAVMPKAETGLENSGEVMKKMRTFMARIDSLNATVASMEHQLRSLYTDKERLEQEIGASEVEDVIAAFNNLHILISNLESQLSDLYGGIELMENEIGKSDPQEIIRLFKNVTSRVYLLQTDLKALQTWNTGANAVVATDSETTVLKVAA